MKTKEEWARWFDRVKNRWYFPEGVSKKEIGSALLRPDIINHLLPIATKVHNGVISSLVPAIYEMRGFKAGMTCGNISMLNVLSMISVMSHPIVIMADLPDKGSEEENIKVTFGQMQKVRDFMAKIEAPVVRIATMYTIPIYTTWNGGDNQVAKDGVTYPMLFGIMLLDDCDKTYTRLSAINLDVGTRPDEATGGTYYPAATTEWCLDEAKPSVRDILISNKWDAGILN